MTKIAVKSIIEGLSVDTICAKLHVSHHAVRYAKTDGIFPAAWYAGLLELCQLAGIDCPLSAFNWKRQLDADTQAALSAPPNLSVTAEDAA